MRPAREQSPNVVHCSPDRTGRSLPNPETGSGDRGERYRPHGRRRRPPSSQRGYRVPPHNVEAEAAALGSMMLSAEAIADVVELLQAEDFYRSANGRIFEVLHELYARGEPVDQLSAVEALRRKGTLDDVGGLLYIRDLTDQVPTPASAAHYARIVAQAALPGD